jgi:signal transduction histidine kinase
LRFASRSSTSPGAAPTLVLAVAVALAAAAAVLSSLDTSAGLAAARIAVAAAAALALALYLVSRERRRHRRVEEQLAAEATFLESLVESAGRIASTRAPRDVLRRACTEAGRLFSAEAELVEPGEQVPQNGRVLTVPLRVRDEEIAVLRLERDETFAREDVARALVLADIAARSSENARLFAEVRIRELERSRLSDQLITAEQEERRRLADELHDGAVQSLAGIALMLDATRHAIEEGRGEDAQRVLASALDRHRDTIRSLRDLSFNLEPVVLRDQGFTPAVQALAENLGAAGEIQFEIDVEAAESLGEKTQAALYQIIRETVNQAIRRGPPSHVSVHARGGSGSEVELRIVDDAPGERRRATYDEIAQRARTLNGTFAVEQGQDGGTSVTVRLPGYA